MSDAEKLIANTPFALAAGEVGADHRAVAGALVSTGDERANHDFFARSQWSAMVLDLARSQQNSACSGSGEGALQAPMSS